MPALERTLRLLSLDGRDAMVARRVLGPNHPLARAVSRQNTLAVQVAVACVAMALGAMGVMLHHPRAALVLVAASIVTVALLVGLALTRQLTRYEAQSLIADGSDDVVLAVVTRERHRLASRRVREGLARSLDKLLRDAERWNDVFPMSRPLPGVRCLRYTPAEVGDVTAALRGDHVRTQGVALTARLLSDGVASPLYAGDTGRLREELRRIRFLLDARSVVDDATPTRRAA